MTDTVLAALDDSTAAAPVLAAARTMAELLGLDLVAIHVQEGDRRTASRVAAQHDVDLRVVDGDPLDEIVTAAGSPDVALAVLGLRGHDAGPRPGGHVALAVLERLDTPVLVVPPQGAMLGATHPVARVLVPLEGTSETSESVSDVVGRLGQAGAEVVALHVFDPSTVPAFWDHSGHAEESWLNDFRARWCGVEVVELHLRRGPAAEAIADVARSEDVDLVALSWAGSLDPGRAAVVRGVLALSPVPVLLIPTSG